MNELEVVILILKIMVSSENVEWYVEIYEESFIVFEK